MPAVAPRMVLDEIIPFVNPFQQAKQDIVLPNRDFFKYYNLQSEIYMCLHTADEHSEASAVSPPPAISEY